LVYEIKERVHPVIYIQYTDIPGADIAIFFVFGKTDADIEAVISQDPYIIPAVDVVYIS
jgi:hypothetical protein